AAGQWRPRSRLPHPVTEFHDLAEIALNSNGEAWGNLGYWKEETEYSAACAALARLLGDAVQLDTESVIMDAGFGCGDQLLMWLDHYHIAGLYGVNNSHSQTAFARQRLTETGHGQIADQLHEGDVNDPAHWDFGTGTPSVNRVIALDCAYHFPDRERFWQQTARALQPGGRVGVTDLILTDHYHQGGVGSLVLRAMLKASRIPSQNMIGEKEYIRSMEQAGLEQIELQDISSDVLPAFGKWWQTYQRTARLPWSGRLKYGITARFLDWAWRKNLLRYQLVTAVRP
ncbi:MAG: class I SAM-dependent methyltransferase, partial [Pseudomonadota bacterium]